MDVFENMLRDWWDENGKTVKDEIEDRTGQRPASKEIALRRRDFEEGVEQIYCGVLMFNGDPVAFVTVDWGEPCIKIAYLC